MCETLYFVDVAVLKQRFEGKRKPENISKQSVKKQKGLSLASCQLGPI
jgi:hypothetical protein